MDSHGNNVTITSNDEKAYVLGNYFSQIFAKETKDIYDTSKITNRQSSPKPVNILDKSTHLNIYKSPGPDGFHPRVLFEIRHEIVEPLQIYCFFLYWKITVRLEVCKYYCCI